jgi:hypothetical protein
MRRGLQAVAEAKLEIDKNRPPVLRWAGPVLGRAQRRAIRTGLSLKETPHGP